MSKNTTENEEKHRPVVARTPVEVQRLKLEKLMKNPDKEMLIPEKPKERGAPIVPDFVRNVMGSSAGAGSGEFHVYRHLRRKEYARQHYMTQKAKWEEQEAEYHQKIDDNRLKAEQETAKKRAKRQKKKTNRKKLKGVIPKTESSSSSESSESSDTAEKLIKEDVVHSNNENKEIVEEKRDVADVAEDDKDTVEKLAKEDNLTTVDGNICVHSNSETKSIGETEEVKSTENNLENLEEANKISSEKEV